MANEALLPAQQAAQDTFELLLKHIEETHLTPQGISRDVSPQRTNSQFVQLKRLERDDSGKVTGIQIDFTDLTALALDPQTVSADITLTRLPEGVQGEYMRRKLDGTEIIDQVGPLGNKDISPEGSQVIQRFQTYAKRFIDKDRRGDPREI